MRINRSALIVIAILIIGAVSFFVYKNLSIEYIFSNEVNKLTIEELANILNERELGLTKIIVKKGETTVDSEFSFNLVLDEDKLGESSLIINMNFCYGSYSFTQETPSELLYYKAESGVWPAIECPDTQAELVQQKILDSYGEKSFFLLRNDRIELHFDNGNILVFE